VHRGKLAVLFGVLVIALVGCGSSDEDSLTKAEFVNQANAICGKAEKEKDEDLLSYMKENPAAAKGLTASVEQELVGVAAPPLRQMTEELGDLGAPEGDEDAVSAIIESFEAAIATLEEDPKAVMAGSNPFAEADKLSAQYGIKTCAEI
jgi:hypothetical protein